MPNLSVAVVNTPFKGAVSDSEERWLIVEPHSQVVKCQRFGLTNYLLTSK